MKNSIINNLRQVISGAAKASLDVDWKPDNISLNEPDREGLGDISCPVGQALKKRTGKPTMELAETIKSALPQLEYIREVTITEPGYLNFFLDHQAIFEALSNQVADNATGFGGNFLDGNERIVIEHTSINPNKAAHAGHARNTILGDALASIYRFAGANVEVQNYIDDTGVQVADTAFAYLLPDANYPEKPKEKDYDKIDYFYWDLYTWIQRLYTQEKREIEEREGEDSKTKGKLLSGREALQHTLEDGDAKTTETVNKISHSVVNAHLQTMSRLGVSYNLLVWESHIVSRDLWEHTFELLKAKNAIHYREDGYHKGAWVVEYGNPKREKDNKVLIRSNGIPTYTAKDIAYQMWKFGLIKDFDFGYENWSTPTSKNLWTTVETEGVEPHPVFGRANRVINVIDDRQAYTQEIVYQSLTNLGFTKESEASVHLSYGPVSLSFETASLLGVDVSEKKRSYDMSGRAGIGIKVDDFIDKTEDFIIERTPDISSDTATNLAIATIRYYMLSLGAKQKLIFDMDRALQSQGDTGIYIMYAYARATSILQKGNFQYEGTFLQLPDEITPAEAKLIWAIAGLSQAIREAIEVDDPNQLVQYCYHLASTFSSFYNTSPVNKATGKTKAFRLYLTAMFRTTLANTMICLGIPRQDKI